MPSNNILDSNSTPKKGPILKVLHVDDEEDFLLLTKTYLEKIDARIQVESVSSPELVYGLVREKGDFDIIIADYLMPRITGLKLLEDLRKMGCEIPFVVFTGRGQDDTVIQAFKMGADHYLPKSGESKKLFRDLQQIIVQTTARYRARSSEEKYRILFDCINRLSVNLNDLLDELKNDNLAVQCSLDSLKEILMERSLIEEDDINILIQNIIERSFNTSSILDNISTMISEYLPQNQSLQPNNLTILAKK
ncbi:MAG: response regulator [Candidatus Odinarchaeota archaeon]